jgi:FdhE protein
MSIERWIADHPFLEPLSRVAFAVERAADETHPALPAPNWDAYLVDFRAGVPLLASPNARVEACALGGEAVARMVERAVEVPFPEKLAASARALRDHLRGGPEVRRALGSWLLRGEGTPPPEPGFARFAGWTALARLLAPTVDAFGRRRDEDSWFRGYCPTCGADPAMSQLIESPTGKQRFLSCPCCRSRWRFRRVGCPHCDNDVPDRMDVLEIEGEERLRIDACKECNGYVKTYVGEGEEPLFLADWTTLHLDLLAKDRGLERKGASLYEI